MHAFERTIAENAGGTAEGESVGFEPETCVQAPGDSAQLRLSSQSFFDGGNDRCIVVIQIDQPGHCKNANHQNDQQDAQDNSEFFFG